MRRIKLRNPKRINRILDKIKTYWEKHPDMRFNQLLINLNVIPDGNHWNMQDNSIETALKENINKL